MRKLSNKIFVLKFQNAMTCCVSINAKEGDCWIQLSNCVLSLMLHKCHISHQSMSTELWRLNQAELVSIKLWRLKKEESVSTELWRLKKAESISTELTRSSKEDEAELSFYRAEKVAKVNSVLTEFTRRSKDCYKIRSVNRVQLVNTGSYFLDSVYRAGSASKGIF